MRSDVLAEVADLIDALRPGHPVRVGIDGVCGAGKTSFASELVQVVARGRPAVHLDSDGFHRPRAVRRRGAAARGYYDDAYDLGALVERTLRPLGPGGSRSYVTALLDFATDTPLHDQVAVAEPDAVVVFDCTFLQRADVRPHWDLVVFLRVDLGLAQERAVARDAVALGGSAAAGLAYDERYVAACRIYLAEQDPEARADVVIDHDDPAAPRVVKRP